MKTQIRIAGVGGQGLVSASIVLAEALGVVRDLDVVQTQFYASNITGGASCGDVIASDQNIDFPWILNPDLLVVLAQNGVDNHADKMKPGTRVILDDLMVHDASKFADGVEIYWAPFTKIADELGVRKCANIVALGCLAQFTELLTLDQITEAVDARAPGKPDINHKALSKGYEIELVKASAESIQPRQPEMISQ